MSPAATRARIRAWATERRRLLAGEDGFVIVIAMLLIVIGLAAGAAALSETLSNRGLSTRNERSARALQAADAGVQTELYRANQLNLGALKLTSGLSLTTVLSQLTTCPVPQVNAGGAVIGLQFAATASVGGACPTNGSSGITSPGPNEEPVGNHSYFQTSFAPGLANIGDFIQLNPKIVASGVDDDGTTQISRRVEAILAPVAPFRTLEAVHDLTFDVPPALSVLGIKLAGSTTFSGTAAAGHNLVIDGSSGLISAFTAANISLSGGVTEPSALDYCNTYTHPNLTLNLTLGSITQPASGCGGLVSRPVISISPSKANCAPDTGVLPCSSLFPATVYSSTGTGANEIYCQTSCPTISFQPGDYVLCDFQTTGPVSINPSSTQAVRIFIDSPSSTRCAGDAAHGASGQPPGFKTNIGNFIATQGVGWNALSGTLSATHPSQAQVYVTGNGTNDGTTVSSTGGTLLSGQSMFLYAPTSNITVTGGQSCILGTCVSVGMLAGAFVGYDLEVSGTAVTQDLGLLNYPLSTTLGPFYVKQYIECQPQYPLPTPDPSSGC